MYSPAKLFVAIMAFTTVTAAMPAPENADNQNLEARGGCLGYANYSAVSAKPTAKRSLGIENWNVAVDKWTSVIRKAP
ncbi:hypothetical protein NCS57_00958800 [Fusarium keratoplasticum]|uniref:Uncharacterized protein n=1 Tax=Fusarium keratoplasticum TaxID=1328300 RepID=A0ACC0QRZ6_9HYPO|nr:hypothetical protein NCS57_00958800 [Fusarium keratoplasticum]KAI8663574.1 hypothetical protein NCS57_00958800 [Fusarium keratoplasticum]